MTYRQLLAAARLARELEQRYFDALNREARFAGTGEADARRAANARQAAARAFDAEIDFK